MKTVNVWTSQHKTKGIFIDSFFKYCGLWPWKNNIGKMMWRKISKSWNDFTKTLLNQEKIDAAKSTHPKKKSSTQTKWPYEFDFCSMHFSFHFFNPLFSQCTSDEIKDNLLEAARSFFATPSQKQQGIYAQEKCLIQVTITHPSGKLAENESDSEFYRWIQSQNKTSPSSTTSEIYKPLCHSL